MNKCWYAYYHLLTIARLRCVGGNNSEVGNVVPFLEGGDGVDMENDGGRRCTCLQDCLAEIISDVTELHARLYIRAPLYEWVPDARSIGYHIHNFLNPDGILYWPRVAWKHF